MIDNCELRFLLRYWYFYWDIDNIEIASVHHYQTRLASSQIYHLPRMKSSLGQVLPNILVPNFEIPKYVKSLSSFLFGKQYKNVLSSCRYASWLFMYLFHFSITLRIMPLLSIPHPTSAPPPSLYTDMVHILGGFVFHHKLLPDFRTIALCHFIFSVHVKRLQLNIDWRQQLRQLGSWLIRYFANSLSQICSLHRFAEFPIPQLFASQLIFLPFSLCFKTDLKNALRACTALNKGRDFYRPSMTTTPSSTQ